MTKATPPRPSHSSEDSIQELNDRIAQLTCEVHVLSTILDEVREQLSWLSHNGLPPHAESLNCHTVLKRMAADPTAEDWGQRLEIEHPDGSTDNNISDSDQKQSAPPKRHGNRGTLFD